MQIMIRTTQTTFRRIAALIFAVVMVWSVISSSPVFAITTPQRKVLLSGIRYFNTEDDCLLESGITQLAGNNNIAKIFNYFLSPDPATGEPRLKDYQIAGILGNMKHESAIEPQRLQGTTGGTITDYKDVPRNQAGKAWGLVQWDRAHKMIDPVLAEGNNPNELEVQLDFLWRQLNGETPSPEKKAGDELKASTDVPSATLAFETKYERHAGPPQPSRISDAEAILAEAKNSISQAYILGDSITHGAASKYQSLLSAQGITPVISAVNGRSWASAGNPAAGATGTQGSGEQAVNTDAEQIQKASIIIVALGTSGGLIGNPVDDIVAKLRSLNDRAPIYWVNIASSAPITGQLVAPFNTKLAEKQGTREITVIDWAKIVNSSGNGTYDPTSGLLADGTNPTEAGYAALSSLVIDTVKGDLPNQTDGGACASRPAAANTSGLANTTMSYAWPEYHSAPYIDKKPEYETAVQAAVSEKRYVGGIRYPGVDCGGFVTTLMIDSGFDPTYNSSGKGGSTSIQASWLEDNWESLGRITSTADLQPGDVAIRPGHTFVFVGDIPGFGSQIASASLDERAPMAGHESINGTGVVWYRKK